MEKLINRPPLFTFVIVIKTHTFGDYPMMKREIEKWDGRVEH